jgi:hypothetical protein
VPPDEAIAAVCKGALPAVCFEPDGHVNLSACRPTLLLPGSFNPLHEGHLGLAAAAAKRTGQDTAFELSVANVDKAPLALDQARRRIDQFLGKAALWLTRAPTFVDKAELFPGVVFVVGADTAERLIDARYYRGEDRMIAAMGEMRDLGCRFLVAGRVIKQGRFSRLADLQVPTEFADLFEDIPGTEFRTPISSSQIRQSAFEP